MYLKQGAVVEQAVWRRLLSGTPQNAAQKECELKRQSHKKQLRNNTKTVVTFQIPDNKFIKNQPNSDMWKQRPE